MDFSLQHDNRFRVRTVRDWSHTQIVIVFGGSFAVYGFLNGRTRIYEEGILLSNGICSWQNVASWSIKTVNQIDHLQISIGKWKPVMAVRPDQVDSLKSFLTEKVSQSQQGP